MPDEIERGQGKTIKKDVFLKYLQEDKEELEYLRKGNPKKGFLYNWRLVMEA